jgi:hypothetical protein
VGDLAQRDQHPRAGQRRECRPEIGSAASRDLVRGRLVLRRHAFDRVDDGDAAKPQAVVGSFLVTALGEAELEQRLVEQQPGIVAGERAAGTVGALLARREAAEDQPGLRIPEMRHRRVPPVRMLLPQRLAKADQPRAERTVARRLEMRHGRGCDGKELSHPRSIPFGLSLSKPSPSFMRTES